MSSCQSENHLQLVGFMPMDYGFKELWKYPFIQIQMVSERKKKKVMISSRTFNLVRCIPFFVFFESLFAFSSLSRMARQGHHAAVNFVILNWFP